MNKVVKVIIASTFLIVGGFILLYLENKYVEYLGMTFLALSILTMANKNE